MSSLPASLAFTQQAIIRYGFPVSLTLGNLGNLFIIVMFCQKKHRRNSCSLYLLAAAVFSVIGINWGIGTNMYALYYPPDPFTQSLYLCRVRGYILQSSSLLYKIMILLSCVDRFALTSPRARMRALSTPQVALRVIVGSTIFGMLISMHLPINQTIANNRCTPIGTYGVFFGIYQICIFGVVTPASQIVFISLTMRNLKAVRVRVQPTLETGNAPHSILSKHDRILLRLVLAEIITGMVLTTLYPISTFYNTLTSQLSDKSADRVAIESFMTFVSLIVLFYLNYCVTFYLYLAISKPFRQKVKQFILNSIKRPGVEQTNAVSVSTTVKRRVERTQL